MREPDLIGTTGRAWKIDKFIIQGLWFLLTFGPLSCPRSIYLLHGVKLPGRDEPPSYQFSASALEEMPDLEKIAGLIPNPDFFCYRFGRTEDKQLGELLVTTIQSLINGGAEADDPEEILSCFEKHLNVIYMLDKVFD